jgi:hypothetical protein
MNLTPVIDVVRRDLKEAAVILGCGKTVWEDLDKIGSPLLSCDIMATNWAIPFYFGKPLCHAVSLHGELLDKWVDLRVGLLKDKPPMIHSANLRPGAIANCVWASDMYPPLSGIFAIWIADQLGYKKIYLCGMSLQGGYFWEPSHSHQYAANINFSQYYGIIPWEKIAYSSPNFRARFLP